MRQRLHKLLHRLTVVVIFATPLYLTGCGDDGNEVVTETSEFTFEQMAEMAAKETEEAEKAAESADR